METRKITALGKYSLIVTLPKKWVRMNNLNQGDDVSLRVQPDLSLVISPSIEAVEKQREITLFFRAEEDENTIIRNIIGCYLNGYNTVKLESGRIFTVEQQAAIRSIVRTLYMRIIKSTASSVILQTLMDETMASVVSGIERMHIITSSMCQDTLNAMKNWDEDLAMSVVSLEEDVDQFMYLLLRLIRCAAQTPSLAGQLGLDMVDCLDCQTLVHRIERVADHTTNIAKSIIKLFEQRMFTPKDAFSVLTEAGEIAFNSYNQAVQSYISNTLDNTNEIIDRQKEIERLVETIIPLPYYGESEEKNVLCHICVIRDSIKRISEYAADIAELTMDRSFKA
jgi:phosphate uptake regulator